MDYLQIRDSTPLSSWELKCVERLKSLLTPADSYTFLSIPDCRNILDTLKYSDEARFRWLSGRPQGVYVDTDCYLNELFIPANDCKCYFPMNYLAKYIDIFYIIVNGNINFIQKNFTNGYISGEYYGWPPEELQNLTNDKIGYIPEKVYNHSYKTFTNFYQSQRRAKCLKLI